MTFQKKQLIKLIIIIKAIGQNIWFIIRNKSFFVNIANLLYALLENSPSVTLRKLPGLILFFF